MTAESKTLTAWLTTIGAIVAAVGLGWGQIEPLATWLVANLGIILQRPQVQAVLTSMTIGVLLAGLLPHVLPGRLEAATTKTLTRLLCVVVTFGCAYWLTDPQNDVERRTALIYAFMSSLAASAIWTTLSGLVYRVAPRPESLKP